MRKLKPVNFNKFYKNKSEQIFAERARVAGWSVTKCGYPDFICYKGDSVMLVEVKAPGRSRLKDGQHRFMNFAKRHGLKCYRWSPDKDWLS
jgi:hypothetical protein